MKSLCILFAGTLIWAQDASQIRGVQRGWVHQTSLLTTVPGSERQSADGTLRELSRIQPESLPFFDDEQGGKVLLIRVASGEEAAGIRFHFEDFRLPQNARLYVYGYSPERGVTQIVGPYTGSGPRDSGEFWTRAVAGPEAVIELHLPDEIAALPFTVRQLALVDASEESVSPVLNSSNVETRLSVFRGRVVEHQVVDGMGILEGDILMGRLEELEPVTAQTIKRLERQSFYVNGSMYRWPAGVVPYEIDPAIPSPSRITDAISHWNNALAGHLRLVARTTESAFLRFTRPSSGSTCSSFVGYIGVAGQPVNIGDSCGAGNVIHEIGHAIGLFHEHTRTDRDTYIRVLTSNITSTAYYNFSIQSGGVDAGPYDYGSIMHYGAYSFSANGQPTIETIPAGIPIGQRSALSTGDISSVKAMYPSTSTAPPPPPPPSPPPPPPPPSSTVTVTIGSNPPGRTLVVDGVNVVAPASFSWVIGSSHTISAPNVFASTQYLFSSWSDGGAQTHSVTTPSSTWSLTANYRVRFRITTRSSSDSQGTVVTSPSFPDQYYPAGSAVTVVASPLAGNCFASWSGILATAHSTVSFAATQPYDIIGNFHSGAVSVPASVNVSNASQIMRIPVTANSGCLWRAASLSNWISVVWSTGKGSSSLAIRVSRNPDRTPRTGSLRVNDSTITIIQDGK
jgi:astacin